MNIIGSLDGLGMGAIKPDSMVNADCLEAMALIPDNSIDLILTDPPYYKFKKKEEWDNQWNTSDGFLGWLDTIAEQWHRILKPNGSLYCFASPRMAAKVEVKLGDRFNVVNRITWAKPCPFSTINRGASNSGLISKEALRGYYPNTESIIFCEHYGADNIAKGEAGYGAKCDELRGFIFEPLRAYLDGERIRSGVSIKQIAMQRGCSETMISQHHFSSSQWSLPTIKTYEAIQQTAPGYFTRSYEELRLEYEELRLEYEELRLEYEELRRPFSVSVAVPYTDVWTYPTVGHYPGKHPCEKPLAMLENMITASSREGAIVLDSFSGSASTAIAAINTDRHYICIEKDPHYFGVSCDRVATHNPNAPIVKPKKPPQVPKGQLALF